MQKPVAVTGRMRFQRWYDKLPRVSGAPVCSLPPRLTPPCRGASPGSPDCTGCSPVARNASSPPGLQRCCAGTFSLRFHGLPWGISCARELRGVLPPASFHRLPRPWEGIILCLTRYLEIALSSSQVKDKMPTESGRRIWTKQHTCCCKGCKWGKRFLIGF